MPTPLLPPPTPLLSALPFPALPYAPLPSPITPQWPVPLLSPTLSSSAPAELPSFQLENSAVNSTSPSLSLTHKQSLRTGVSLLSPSSSSTSTADNISRDSLISDVTGDTSDEPSPSLLADALKRIQQQAEHQSTPPLATAAAADASVIQARGIKGAEAYNAVVSLKPTSSLPHSHSFSVGETAAATLVTISSSAANGPSTAGNSQATQSTTHTTTTKHSQSTPVSSSPVPLPSPTSRQREKAAQADQRSMARLASISSLLSHASANTYIILDLDETVYTGFHSPCSMMTEKGLQRYQSIITSHPAYKHLTFSNKSSLTRALQAAVSRKKGVEQDTISTIKQLQSKGVPVFALTARFASMVATTKMELAALGLDLSLTSPFKQFVRDTATNAVISDGIIFTNAHEKGPILNRFLANVLFESHLNGTASTIQLSPTPSSPPLPSSKPISIPTPASATKPSSSSSFNQDFRTLSTSLPSSGAAIIFKTSKKLRPKKLRAQFYDDDEEEATTSNGIVASALDAKKLHETDSGHNLQTGSLPAKIIFVDDRLQNCVSVMNGLRVCQTLNIALLTYHYTPNLDTEETSPTSTTSPTPPTFTEQQLEKERELQETEAAFQALLAGGSDMMDVDDDDDDDDEEDRVLWLAEYQIHHFIRCQQILHDKEAKQRRLTSTRKLANAIANAGTATTTTTSITTSTTTGTATANTITPGDLPSVSVSSVSDPSPVSGLSASLNVYKHHHLHYSAEQAHSAAQLFQTESESAAASARVIAPLKVS